MRDQAAGTDPRTAGQSSGPAQKSGGGATEAKAPSPYEIWTSIQQNPKADLKDIWQRLYINDSDERGGRSSSYPFLEKCNDCQVELWEYDLDEEPGREVVVMVAERLSAARYLVFKKRWQASKEGWRLLGHIDHDLARHRMPQHTILVCSGKTWILVEGQGGSGTDVSLYFTRVFTIEGEKLAEKLSYTSEGHQADAPVVLTREFSARIVDCSVNDAGTRFEVEYVVLWNGYDGSGRELPLWLKKQRATYVSGSGSGPGVLDPTRSDVSEAEIEAVYNIDSLSREAFLRFYFDDLVEIAKGEDRARKEWLRRYLAKCQDVAEKIALIDLLDK